MPKKNSNKNKKTSRNIVKKYEDFMPASNKITSSVFPVNKNPDNNMKKKVIISMIIGSIIGLIINVSALTWLHKLDEINCACSEHWMRSYIKYYLYVIIPIFCIGIIINVYLYISNYSIIDLNNNNLFIFYKSLANIVSLFGFANIFIVIIFINRLKEINCECSEDIKREIYWIYNIILVSILGISLLLMAISALIFFMAIKR